jgi:glycosyltransferase involved in cell wall biosynthesis
LESGQPAQDQAPGRREGIGKLSETNPDNPEMKNLLIAAYYFPPYALVSSVRVTKFCKYLPQFGWKPRVLTVATDYYQGRILSEMPPEVDKIKIDRIPFCRFPGAVAMVKLLFPVILILFALRHKQHIDGILLSGSPFHPFLSTIILRGLLGIPTILDFRDSWSPNFGYGGEQPANFLDRFKHRFFELIERISIRFASGVTFATDILLEEYRRLIPGQGHKYYTIHNGYDPEDFIAIDPRRLDNRKTIILTGQFNIYTPEVVNGLMQALKFFPLLHFIYIGSEHELISKKARKFESSNQVTTLPYSPYRKMLALVAGADYGLVTNGMVNGMGTKIFDYLALKKPTLCFVPKGSAITSHFSGVGGVVISEAPHTLASIKNGLSSVFKATSTSDDHLIHQFSRKESARTLARILQKASMG